MMPQYAFALGGTHAVKKFIEFLESQPEIEKGIVEKINRLKSYQDAT